MNGETTDQIEAPDTHEATRSASIGALAAALAKAQGEMHAAAKDSTNPHFKSRYADLASVWDACREALSKNGIAVLQPVRADGARVTVTTLLAHTSGEWIGEALTITAQQATPQGVGSAITYGRRYGLSAMVGVAPDDDDGEGAEGRGVHPQAARNRQSFENAKREFDPAGQDSHESYPPDYDLGPTDVPPPRTATPSGPVVTEAQAKRFYAIAKGAGWNDTDLKAWLKEVWNLDSSREIPRGRKYDDICTQVARGPQVNA